VVLGSALPSLTGVLEVSTTLIGRILLRPGHHVEKEHKSARNGDYRWMGDWSKLWREPKGKNKARDGRGVITVRGFFTKSFYVLKVGSGIQGH